MVLEPAELPSWLSAVAAASVLVAIVCAALIVVDVVRRPQPMGVMNVVWPATALFGSLLWLWAYARWGRAPRRGAEAAGHRDRPMPVAVFVGTCHCGAGCSLADLVVEGAVFAVPALAVVGGFGWLFQDEIFAVWVLASAGAWMLGVAFQYFAIAPMRGGSAGANIAAAIKADTLSILAWQLGMYGTMAIVQFAVLPAIFGGRVQADSIVFWGAMQLAMLVGFVVAYPVNWWLIRAGVKERM